jgi:hypothetical protein
MFADGYRDFFGAYFIVDFQWVMGMGHVPKILEKILG